MFGLRYLFLFLTLIISAHAEEYRFRCMGEVTGLCDRLYDAEGKETIVRLDFANREIATVFKALQTKRIYGTRSPEDHEGVSWEQAIYLTGEFTSELSSVIPPEELRDRPELQVTPIEPHRQFKVTGLRLQYPVWRFQEILKEGEVDGPVMMEVHFSHHSLFPDGISLNKKSIDLAKYSRERAVKP